ncbi:MAG: MFS transporter [Acidobacteria bacterium]|nr:MFS transporter [Acidobacteriota bacterium]
MSSPQQALRSAVPTVAAPASRQRHWVVVFAVSLAVLAYIDRVCISYAAPLISRDLGFDREQMGVVFSAFALAYALFEIPGGWLGDRMGPRRVLLRITLWWSAFTALTGATWNFTSMLAVRWLFGAGEAGCFPNLTKAFTTWLPTSERVRAQGVMWMFARWGGAFTPPLVLLVLQFTTWRWAFVLFGSLGLVWAAAFAAWFRDNPRDNPRVNAAELHLLKGSEHLAGGHGQVPWAKLMRSRSVWLLWLQYFLLSYPWYFYITWLPTYLQSPTGRGLSPEAAAGYAIFPLLFGGFGSLFCGLLSAHVERWTGSVTLSRRLLACIGFAGASAFLLASIYIRDPLWAMLAMGMASFSNDLVMPGAWGACMDVGGKYAGTLAGSMNMMGNLAGFVAPWAGGYILQNTGDNWNILLYVMVGAYLLGVACWPFIDPSKPLEDAEPAPAPAV